LSKRTFSAGVTSQTIDIFIQDSSSTTGAGLSGLAFNSSGLKAYYRKGATGSATSITLATQTVGGAWSSGGFVEIDATNMKGVYRFDVPDTVLAATPWAILYFYGATNMAPVVAELEIVSYNPFDGVRLGLTALPNAAAEAAGGLYTRGTGAGQINQDANGRIDANVKTWIGGAIPAVNVTGVPKVDVVDVGGTAQTARDLGAQLDAAVSTRATPAQILTTALTEAYAAVGAAGTLSQILFLIQQRLNERAISGTTETVKKLDGSTTAATFTLNDATNPTSITRAS
jgi:hypothetical protein